MKDNIIRNFKINTYRGDFYSLGDSFNSSRDISSLSFKENKDSFDISIGLDYLKQSAQNGNLDLYLLINFSDNKKKGLYKLPDLIKGYSENPYDIAVSIYDENNKAVYDKNGRKLNSDNFIKNVKFDWINNKVDFTLSKKALKQMGWKEGTSFKLIPFTTKDFSGIITDSFDLPQDKAKWYNSLMTGQSTDSYAILHKQIDVSKPELADVKSAMNWKEHSIYFILVDRFYDGDKSNDINIDRKSLERFHGGDLQGIIDKLDYIKDILHLDTIWISPIIKNKWNFKTKDGKILDGYHGYWPMDFYKVDEHFGSLDTFKKLVKEAHKRGMKVLLDMPLNHLAYGHPWLKDPAKKDWFHHLGPIKNWDDENQVKNGDMFGLPDLNQENPEVYNYLLNMSKWWIKNTNIDGFRLDAVRHISNSFWQKFSKDIKDFAGPDFLLLGEVLHGDPNYVSPYQNVIGLPSEIDIPMYYTIKEVFAEDKPAYLLGNRLKEEEQKFSNPSMLAAILDSHDFDRFLTSAKGDKNKLKMALAYLFTINRIPLIYQGTEFSMEGATGFGTGGKPENRKDVQWYKDKDMLNYVSKLSQLHNKHKALKEGALLELYSDKDIYAYSRISGDDEVIVIINNSNDMQRRDIPIRKEELLKNNDKVKDFFTNKTFNISNNSVLSIEIQPKSVMILEKRG